MELRHKGLPRYFVLSLLILGFLLICSLSRAQTPMAQTDPIKGSLTTTAAAAANCTAQNCITLPTLGYSVVSVSVHGTYAGVTLNFEGSDDGGTTWYPTACSRVDIAVQETSEAVATNATQAWDCAVYGWNQFEVRQSARASGTTQLALTMSTMQVEPALTVSLAASTPADATSGTNVSGQSFNMIFNGTTWDRQRTGDTANLPALTGSSLTALVAVDPCQSSAIAKSSKSISIASATTTNIVAVSASTVIYVCGGLMTLDVSGTSKATAQFEEGTGGTCGANTVVKTGTYSAENTTQTNDAIILAIPGGMTAFSTTAARELCIVTTGTTVSLQGYITYVQR